MLKKIIKIFKNKVRIVAHEQSACPTCESLGLSTSRRRERGKERKREGRREGKEDEGKEKKRKETKRRKKRKEKKKRQSMLPVHQLSPIYHIHTFSLTG